MQSSEGVVYSTAQEDGSITNIYSWKERWQDHTPGASLLMQFNGGCPDVVAGERGKDPSSGNGVAFRMVRRHQVPIPIVP